MHGHATTQMRNQVVLLVTLAAFSPTAGILGQSWTRTVLPQGNWLLLTCSADGTRFAAADYYGGIHTSTNGGQEWAAADLPNAGWQGLTGSSDGRRLAALPGIGPNAYTSTNWAGRWATSTL